MEHLDELFPDGGEIYTKEEIKYHLIQYMAEEDADVAISEAEKMGFIYLANCENGVEVYVR